MGKYGLALDNLARRRRRDGRRERSCRPAPRSIRTCSGPCAAAAATSASSRGSSAACTRWAEIRRPRRASLRRARDVLRFYRDVTATCPTSSCSSAGSCTRRRLRHQAGRISPCATADRTRRRSETSLRPIEFGSPPSTSDRPDASTARPNDAGRRLPARRPELLEIDLLDDAERRRDRRDGGRVSGVPVADERPGARVLPRGGHARPDEHGLHRTEGWNLLATSIWTDANDTDKNVAWTRETLAAMAPYAANRRWIGYLDRDDYAADRRPPPTGPTTRGWWR